MKKYIALASALILTAFGLITLFMSTAVIFDLFGIRAKEGNYVPFIVWTNWGCGFMYLAAAYGIWKSKAWVTKLLAVVALVLAGAFIGLFFYIQSGGIYETKMVGAMAFRMTVTIVFAVVSYFTAERKV